MTDQCPSRTDSGEQCILPEGHPGTSYLHTTAPDEAGMATGWGSPPEGVEFTECPECGQFGLMAPADTIVIAHDHTDNSHSWLHSDGEVGSLHIVTVNTDDQP